MDNERYIVDCTVSMEDDTTVEDIICGIVEGLFEAGFKPKEVADGLINTGLDLLAEIDEVLAGE